METLARHKWLIILCLSLCFGLTLAGAEPRAGWGQETKAPESEYPLSITATRLEADHIQQVVTFSGEVVARHRDMILYTDVLKIYYQMKQKSPAPAGTPGKKAPPTEAESPLEAVGIEKIDKIVAQGHVRLVQEDKVASGDRAVYYKPEEKIVLLGHPQLWQGENSVKGDRIIFYLKDNRAVVEGSPQRRVKAVLYPAAKPALPGPADR